MTTPAATSPAAGKGNIRVCARCGVHYDWRRSTSGSLKMTYCGSICERSDLGFTIEALLRTTRSDQHRGELVAA
jgi:hypothetical protein